MCEFRHVTLSRDQPLTIEEMEKRGDREKIGTALPALHMHTFVKSMQRNRGQSVNAPLYKKQMLIISLPAFCQIRPEFRQPMFRLVLLS